ncbi:MAG: Methyltransferase protein [Verrucomicrobiaceae bacterium]|nr:Methyltransferase protein [Verrucomicrobiaceae bacterium]
MKDLVDNRRRISFSKKLSLLGLVLKENGLLWCSAFGVYYVCSQIADRAFAFMDSLRRKHGVPGLNSRALNKAIWEAWDWGAGGEEWSPSEEWKQSVITQVLEKQMPASGSILEIGPGGGRWTTDLIKRATLFTAVDISESCVDVCRQKFASATNATFMVGSGRDLAGVPDASQDGIWSFDVFVHINRPEVSAYLDEFLRVMKPGAIAVLHHGSVGGMNGGWRSDMTGEAMAEMLKARAFELISMSKEWQDGAVSHKAGLYEDLITVFRRR